MAGWLKFVAVEKPQFSLKKNRGWQASRGYFSCLAAT
jgi:hypothetical protein